MGTVNLPDVLPVIGASGTPDPRSAPISAYRYLDTKRELINAEARSRPLIRLWDNRFRYIGTVAAEQSVNAEEMLHDTGQGDIVLRGDDWLVDFLRRDVRKDEDLHVTIDPHPHRRSWRWRWNAKVTNVRVKRAEDGTRTVTLECSHNREHWKHLLFGATPFCDPAVQPIKAWLLPGNTRSIIATTAFINLARNYYPLLALPTQALNPGAWAGESSNLLNLNPLNWPVQIQFVNPIFDQSRFSVIMSRWSDAHSVTEALLRDAGCAVRAYCWLPEDEDSPHPELAAIVGEEAARPTRACIVLAVEDNSGITGPTGTLVDGALSLAAATLDNLVTEQLVTLDPDYFDRNGDGVTDPLIRRILGVAPATPDITFRDTEHSAIVSSEHSMFRTKAQKILTGGKSPGWVNQMQCVHGSTVIDGPDGKERIDVLAARGDSFRVWSLTPEGQRVAATAEFAFKKGTAELFDYTLDDGRTITATAQHRFLTDRGFIAGADITVGSMIATAGEQDPAPAHTPTRPVRDEQYVGLAETAAVKYRPVVSITAAGVDDFYDMHVPGWENYLAHGIWNHNTFAIKYALSKLSEVIQTVVGPELTGAQAPATPGLEEIYQSQLDDVLLAFIQVTDPIRSSSSGPYGYLEHFEQGTGSAFTISSALTLREGHFKTRAYQAFKVQIRDGQAHTLYYDYDLGTRCHFEIDGVLHTDQITALKLHYDQSTPKTFDLVIGDDRESENPMAAAMRSLATLWNAVGMLMGSGDMF